MSTSDITPVTTSSDAHPRFAEALRELGLDVEVRRFPDATRTAAEAAAAVRESSVIVGAGIGALFFKERFGGPRIAAAGLMVLGIGLMLHTG